MFFLNIFGMVEWIEFFLRGDKIMSLFVDTQLIYQPVYIWQKKISGKTTWFSLKRLVSKTYFWHHAAFWLFWWRFLLLLEASLVEITDHTTLWSCMEKFSLLMMHYDPLNNVTYTRLELGRIWRKKWFICRVLCQM